MKPLLTELKVRLAAFLGFLLIKSIYLTCRAKGLNIPTTETYLKARRSPVIITFWHSQQLIIPGLLRPLFSPYEKRRTFTLISEHSDGRIISKVTSYFGLDNVPGSSTRSGRKAAIRLIKVLKAGDNIAITPDGPRGPVNQSKEGVLRVAQLSGAPILPIAGGASSSWRMTSWDKMVVPKFFSRLQLRIGEPMYISEDLDDAGIAAELEKLNKTLDTLSREAEEFSGA